MKGGRLVGYVVLAAAIAAGVVGIVSWALDDLDWITPHTAAIMGLVSIGGAAAIAIVGFVLRRRVRRAHDGMVVGLATLGAWFLAFVYALGQDTP